MTKSPNEELADKIVDKLLSDGLVEKKRKTVLQSALTTGKVKAADWRLWAEDVVMREVQDGSEESPDQPDA